MGASGGFEAMSSDYGNEEANRPYDGGALGWDDNDHAPGRAAGSMATRAAPVLDWGDEIVPVADSADFRLIASMGEARATREREKRARSAARTESLRHELADPASADREYQKHPDLTPEPGSDLAEEEGVVDIPNNMGTTILRDHLEAMRKSKSLVATPELEAWLERLVDAAATAKVERGVFMAAVLMPSVHKLDSFLPAVGLGVATLDRPGASPPIYAPGLFKVHKFNYGHTAVRIPHPTQDGRTARAYEILRSPASVGALLQGMREIVNEPGSGMQYPGSHFGVYRAVEQVGRACTEVFWLVAADGDRAAAADYLEYVTGAHAEGRTLKETFHGGEASPIVAFQQAGFVVRKRLIGALIALLDLRDAIDAVSRDWIDVPHTSFAYNSRQAMMLFGSEAVYARNVQRHLIAVSPLEGYVLLSGTDEPNSVDGATPKWSAAEQLSHFFPVSTGNVRPVLGEDLARPPPAVEDPNPCVVNAAGESAFVRKLGSYYRHYGVDFRATLRVMGFPLALEETRLAPAAVVIWDRRSDADAFKEHSFFRLADSDDE